MDTITTTGKQGQPIPAHIRHHLQNQPSSGKTISEYCKEAGFSAWTFYNWRKRYGHQLNVPENKTSSPSSSKPLMSFTTIGSLPLAQNRQSLFDIRFSTGTTVGIYHGTTAQEFAPFLSLLSGDSPSC